VRAVEGAHCSRLLPDNGGPGPSRQEQLTRLADARSFARCTRSHGVSRFPDPAAKRRPVGRDGRGPGSDVRSTAVLHVVRSCLPASHGGLTAASVTAAIARATGH
jgi:hypothetical protein